MSRFLQSDLSAIAALFGLGLFLCSVHIKLGAVVSIYPIMLVSFWLERQTRLPILWKVLIVSMPIIVIVTIIHFWAKVPGTLFEYAGVVLFFTLCLVGVSKLSALCSPS